MRTIIGAKAFHCPVRDGKEWGHLTMVVRHNRFSPAAMGLGPARLGRPQQQVLTESNLASDWRRADGCRRSCGSCHTRTHAHIRCRSLKTLRCCSVARLASSCRSCAAARRRRATGSQSYRVKPHGPLVLVSSMHCCTYTPSLSTSWSTTTLQGGQAPRQISSWDEFPA